MEKVSVVLARFRSCHWFTHITGCAYQHVRLPCQASAPLDWNKISEGALIAHCQPLRESLD